MRRFLIAISVILNLCLLLYITRFRKFDDGVDPRHQETAKTEMLHEDSNFIPTHEWQTISKDQPTQGLHVRINLQTGERVAKLLETDKSNRNPIIAVPSKVKQNGIVENGREYKINEIKDALKNIKQDATTANDKDEMRVKNQFRSYDKLKEELAGINLNIKTDQEILDEWMINFRQLSKRIDIADEDMIVTELNNLEILLHQVDNARNFAKNNGMTDVIVPCLSANSTKIRRSATNVLGSAVQNNAVVKISALEAGVIPLLLRTISLDKNYKTKSSALYALSCLIRMFPHAQLKFIDAGGFAPFEDVFRDYSAEALKLQLKVVTLLSDLLEEKIDTEQSIAEQNSSKALKIPEAEKDQMKEKLRQYNLIHLDKELLERGWCEKLGQFLVDHAVTKGISDSLVFIVNSTNENNNIENKIAHDYVSAAVNAMLPLADLCYDDFNRIHNIRYTIINLTKYYASLAANDELGYYEGIFKVLYELSLKLKFLHNEGMRKMKITS